MVGRLVDRLKSKLGQVDKVVRGREDIERRRREAGEERGEASRLLGVLGGKTRQLQGEVEGEIGVRYQGRRVNIMGVQV